MARKARRKQAGAGTFERSGLRRAIVIVVAAKVAAIVLAFDPAGIDPFDLTKSLVSRAFEWVLAGLLVAAVARYGPGIVPRSRLHAFVAAFALANVVAALFAEQPYVALFGERSRYLGLTFIGDMLVLYVAVAVAFRATRDWATLAAIVGAAAAVSVAYAAMQYAGRDPFPWEISSRDRPYGTIGHPDMFGHFLSIAFGVALGIAVAASPRDAGTRNAAIAAAFVALAGIGIAATRGSALGIAAAVAAAPVVALRVRPIAAGQLRRIAPPALVAFAAIVALVLVSPMGARLRATVGGYAVQDRIVIYENALSAFRDRPIAGWGPDAFAVAYPRYRQERETALHGINRLQSSAHDTLLQAGVTTGIVGLGALLALVGAGLLGLWRAGLVRAPAVAAPLLVGSAAYWAHALVSPDSISVGWFPWVVFGAVAATTGARPAEDAERVALRRPAQAVVVVAAVAALIVTYPAFRANEDAQAAAVATQAGNAGAAVARAESAVANDPGRAQYWSVLGAAHQRRRAWRDAVDAQAESARRAPYVAIYWINLAYAEAGRAVATNDPQARDAALAAGRRATETDPNEPLPHARLARIASDFGHHELAYREIRRAIQLYQGEAEFDAIAATVAAQSPDAKAALAFLEGLLAYKDSPALRAAISQTTARSR